MEKFFLETEDNINIAVNHIKNNHKEVIILVHGWFMTKDSRAFSSLADDLSAYFDVISFDCRGHGKSSGFYTFTSKETIDLKTVVDYAKSFYEKIYLIGFSLGGALVLIHSALNKDVDKVIAVSAPSDFNKIENQMWKKEAWLPTLKKFEPERWFSIRPSLFMQKKMSRYPHFLLQGKKTRQSARGTLKNFIKKLCALKNLSCSTVFMRKICTLTNLKNSLTPVSTG